MRAVQQHWNCLCRFKAVNGILIPGGGANLGPNHSFYDTASQLLKLALAANDAGDYFPVLLSLLIVHKVP